MERFLAIGAGSLRRALETEAQLCYALSTFLPRRSSTNDYGGMLADTVLSVIFRAKKRSGIFGRPHNTTRDLVRCKRDHRRAFRKAAILPSDKWHNPIQPSQYVRPGTAP